MSHRFTQVDVFTAQPLLGNPLAVVHAADDLTDEQMAAFARWTNLSETTFLLRPTGPEADYRVRIFTTGGELPFAGHPTLGSASAWLAAGGVPRDLHRIVQQCGAGLITLRRTPHLAFAAPALVRSGPIEPAHLARITRALGVSPDQIVDSAWVDNGPGWIGVQLASAKEVLALTPDAAAFSGLKVGVIGPHTPEDAARLGVDVEVRAFYADNRDFGEDPVTGSLNAGIAQWLIGDGTLPAAYTAGQGRLRGRDGRLQILSADNEIWVGGDVVTCIEGSVNLG